MKRSEFVAKLHDREDPWVTSVVELAEAAGVVWDPEQERLTVQAFPSGILQLIPEASAGWSSEEARLRGLEEAARRNNAWPELERLESWVGGILIFRKDDGQLFQQKLRRILESGKK